MFISQKAPLLLNVLLFSVIGTAYAELPQVSDGRIIQPPPGANVAAAYFTVTNSGDQPLVINDVSSDAVSNASLHLSSVVDDVARMEEQASITIEAGESLEFKHGSYHVMLMGLTEPLVAGNEFSLQLDTSEGPLSVSIPVITPDEATAMDDMAHDAMKHDGMSHDDAGHETMNHDGMSHESAEHETMEHDGANEAVKKGLDVK